MNYIIDNLNDSGFGSLRFAITEANGLALGNSLPSNNALVTNQNLLNTFLAQYRVNAAQSLIIFAVTGNIGLLSDLPAITSNVFILALPGVFPITIDCQKQTSGLVFAKGSVGSNLVGVNIIRAKSDGIYLLDNQIIIDLCTIKNNKGNGIAIRSNNNIIGTNPTNASNYTANTISNNKKNGISFNRSKNNIIVKNRILKNQQNGIFFQSSSNNTIGGTVFTNSAGQTNDPTGTENTVPPIFIIPPLGNQISGNKFNGVYLSKKSRANIFNGNFIGTSFSGTSTFGNQLNGVLIQNSDGNIFKGCDIGQNPFVYYNVIGGNKLNGFHVTDSNRTIIEGNYSGLNATNNASLGNGMNGLLIDGASDTTLVGGPIPLGNNFSGNGQNGIVVAGTASGVLSYNSFCGLASFGGAIPNGQNGILVTTSGQNNRIRTCVCSGNLQNGIVLSGEANHVTLDPVLCGTQSDGDTALPNGVNGLVLSGNANNNFIGSQERSVIPTSVFSSNTVNGILITDKAHDNVIYDCNIGLSVSCNSQLPNTELSILLTGQCQENIITDCYIDGSGILTKITKNNKLICNYLALDSTQTPFLGDMSQIVDQSKNANLIILFQKSIIP
jgi:parallel beta-helix repeat protein